MNIKNLILTASVLICATSYANPKEKFEAMKSKMQQQEQLKDERIKECEINAQKQAVLKLAKRVFPSEFEVTVEISGLSPNTYSAFAAAGETSCELVNLDVSKKISKRPTENYIRLKEIAPSSLQLGALNVKKLWHDEGVSCFIDEDGKVEPVRLQMRSSLRSVKYDTSQCLR